MVTWLLISLLGVIAVAMLVVLIRIKFVLRRYTYTPAEFTDTLPTISVCIPARNEKHAMTECLERVLASEYPKLEIIVLDDSSVDDTSMLIKSFAHAGVRFVEGRPLPDGWLGKNNALQGLLEEASGRYILFLDVDTTLKSHSMNAIVSWAIARNLPLASIIPQREDGLRASIFLGTMRYFWMLLLGTKQNPAMSGAAWLVHRQKLLDLGGFTPYKNLTQPEIAIARTLNATDGRQVVVSNKFLGVSYEKKWSSQVETSLRLMRPLLGSSLVAVATAFILATIVVVPFMSLITFILQSNAIGIGLVTCVLLLITMVSLTYYRAAWRYGWWLGALHWPYVVIQEAILLIVSVILYSRGSITWKGRPILNKTISHTPELPTS